MRRVVLLACSGIVLAAAAVASPGELEDGQPGAGAVEAHEVFETDRQRESCEALLDQMRGGSEDAWVDGSGAICAHAVNENTADVWLSQGRALKSEGEYEKALASVEIAKVLYETTGNRLGQAWASAEEAEIHLRSGDYRDAVVAYRQAREHYTQSPGQAQEEARMLHREGQTLMLLGEHENAMMALREAEGLYRALDSPLVADVLQDVATLLCMEGDDEGAWAAIGSAREMGSRLQGNEASTRSLAGLSLNLAKLNRSLAVDQDMGSALSPVCKALVSFGYLGDELGVADALTEKANIHLARGESAAAADSLALAAKSREALSDLKETVSTLKEIAAAQLDRGEHEQSAETLDQVASLLVQQGEREAAGNVYMQIASLHLQMQNLDAGSRSARQAQTQFERVGNQDKALLSIFLQALFLGWQGRTESALKSLSLVLVEPEEKEFALEVGWRLGRAFWLVQFGYRQRAAEDLRRAEVLFDGLGPNGRRLEATWSLIRGHVLITLLELRPAIQAFRKARRIAAELGDLPLVADAWSAECHALKVTGAATEAEACSAAARAESGEGGHQALREFVIDVDRTLPGGAQALNPLKQLQEARELVERGEGDRALELLNAIEILDQWPYGAAWQVTAGVAHSVEGRSAQAVEHLRRGRDEFLRHLQSGFVTRQQKAAAFDKLNHTNQLLVLLLDELDRPEEALLEAEAGRALTILSALRDLPTSDDSPDGPELRARRKAIEGELAAIDTDIRAADRGTRRSLLKRREEVDRQLSLVRLDAVLQKEVRALGGGLKTMEDVWGVVEKVGPVVYYHLMGEKMLAFLLLPDERRIHRATVGISGPWSAEAKSIEQLNVDLANPIRELEEVGEDWRARWMPFASELPAEGPLVIIPHGPMHKVPFAALVNGKDLLGEQYRLSFAPSLAVLNELLKKEASTELELLAIASGRGLGLPIEEVRQVASMFGSDRVRILSSGDATVEQFQQWVPRARQVLIASRAVATSDPQRLSYLEFEPSAEHDSRLTAAELATMPLEAELVTLAACDTAVSEPLLSDDHLDLARAFLLAGAKSVLATRWKLPEDYRTSLFLQDFYRLYLSGGASGRGLSKGEALRRARTNSRRRGDPAQIWAAWVLIGDAS